MQKSTIYQAVFGSSEPELTDLNAAVDDLEKQLNIDTATWALDIYEKDLGIKTEHNKPLSDRRSVIKSKERGTGKVDAGMLETVADSYVNGDAVVTFDGSIQLAFTGILGIPPNMEDLQGVIENLKPAHLAIFYHYLYRRHSELISYTHGELNAFTHNMLREGDLI